MVSDLLLLFCVREYVLRYQIDSNGFNGAILLFDKEKEIISDVLFLCLVDENCVISIPTDLVVLHDLQEAKAASEETHILFLNNIISQFVLERVAANKLLFDVRLLWLFRELRNITRHLLFNEGELRICFEQIRGTRDLMLHLSLKGVAFK